MTGTRRDLWVDPGSPGKPALQGMTHGLPASRIGVGGLESSPVPFGLTPAPTAADA
jgi:hypothetical protein